MPLYEFVCNDCGSSFEKRVAFTAVTAPTCGSCRSDNVQRQLSAPAIHFKGNGWYINDSKKRGQDSSSTAESSAE